MRIKTSLGKEYSLEDMVLNVGGDWKNDFDSNNEHLNSLGIIDGEEIDLGNEIQVQFYAKTNRISKRYIWRNRYISKQTAFRRLGIELVE